MAPFPPLTVLTKTFESYTDLLEKGVDELLVINVTKCLAASMKRPVLGESDHVVDLRKVKGRSRSEKKKC